jgi:hypothetical protein
LPLAQFHLALCFETDRHDDPRAFDRFGFGRHYSARFRYREVRARRRGLGEVFPL